MKIPIYQVDAFAASLFSGNPAAVVFPESELPFKTMQSIGAENNLAETAFVLSDGGSLQIRWFTPTVEVDLCGHATLAAAHVMFKHLGYSGNKISFGSKSGPLHVFQEEDLLYLDFPTDSIGKVETTKSIVNGLGAEPVQMYSGRSDYLVILGGEEDVASLSPNMHILSKVPARGVIVTAPGQEVDFVSRFFAPQSGVAEDPVTGSAHTTLIPYWSRKLGKKRLLARQLSKRGGELLCRDLGDRVRIGGRAVTYLEGHIAI
jgi:PhzF family phenazine biosynthesis protein